MNVAYKLKYKEDILKLSKMESSPAKKEAQAIFKKNVEENKKEILTVESRAGTSNRQVDSRERLKQYR